MSAGVDGKSRKFLIVLVAAVVPFSVAMVYLLMSVFGAPAVGVRCMRAGGVARCEVLGERFLGLVGDSDLAIPESEIIGARTLAPLPHTGRGSGEYSVALMLRSGAYRNYPVWHSRFRARAEDATRKLNDYFASVTATSIELHEDSSELLLPLGIPLAAVAVALAGRAMRRRAQSLPRA